MKSGDSALLQNEPDAIFDLFGAYFKGIQALEEKLCINSAQMKHVNFQIFLHHRFVIGILC